MSDAILEAAMDSKAMMRQLEPNWDAGMIAASIAISFLGAFTSTQLFVSFLPSFSLSLFSLCPYETDKVL